MELEWAKIKSQSDGVDKISMSQTKSGMRKAKEREWKGTSRGKWKGGKDEGGREGREGTEDGRTALL